MRDFFGVQISYEGKILLDNQEPGDGFIKYVMEVHDKLKVGKPL